MGERWANQTMEYSLALKNELSSQMHEWVKEANLKRLHVCMGPTSVPERQIVQTVKDQLPVGEVQG